MDLRKDVREFLTSRRARVTPDQVGLRQPPEPVGGRRKVAGLRRAEVAELTGISEDYYVRLERGDLTGVSEQVLNAVARALRLDEAERSHLHDLAKAANSRSRSPRRRTGVRPAVQHLLDAMGEVPAFVRNGRLDVLATNRVARILHEPVFAGSTGTPNFARFCFLDQRAHEMYPDWDAAADATVALLRTEAGRDPFDRPTAHLIEELSARSEAFADRWARHDVRLHLSGVKYLRHPLTGLIELAFESLPIPADPGLTLAVYSAEPGTPSAGALRLLTELSNRVAVSTSA